MRSTDRPSPVSQATRLGNSPATATLLNVNTASITAANARTTRNTPRLAKAVRHNAATQQPNRIAGIVTSSTARTSYGDRIRPKAVTTPKSPKATSRAGVALGRR